MILERRQILFDLVEAHALLYQAFNTNPEFENVVPRAFGSYQILGALHMRHFADVPQELRAAMLALVVEAPENGVIFRILKKNAARHEKEIGFVVPEDLMLGLLVAECIKRKIPLPMKADKSCLTKEMYVGIGFSLETRQDSDLQLE